MDKYDEETEGFFCTGFHSEVKDARDWYQCLTCCRWDRESFGVKGDCFVCPMGLWGREADHSPPTSAEVKKMWIYTSTPLYVFTA
jgi:hypothetical protein